MAAGFRSPLPILGLSTPDVVLIEGVMVVTFAVKQPATSFSAEQPSVSMTAKQPAVSLSAEP